MGGGQTEFCPNGFCGGGGSNRNVSLIVGLPSAKRHWICERLEPTLDISLIKQTKGSAKHHHEHWDVKLVDRTQAGLEVNDSDTYMCRRAPCPALSRQACNVM